MIESMAENNSMKILIYKTLNDVISEANISSLTPIFQGEVLDKPYTPLTPEEKERVNNHIKLRKDEASKQVDSITDNKQYQGWIYDLLMAVSKWVEKYNNIYVGSFNRDRTYIYKRILNSKFKTTEITHTPPQMGMPESWNFMVVKK